MLKKSKPKVYKNKPLGAREVMKNTSNTPKIPGVNEGKAAYGGKAKKK